MPGPLVLEPGTGRETPVRLACPRPWRLGKCAPRFIKAGAPVRDLEDDRNHWILSQPADGHDARMDHPDDRHPNHA